MDLSYFFFAFGGIGSFIGNGAISDWNFQDLFFQM